MYSPSKKMAVPESIHRIKGFPLPLTSMQHPVGAAQGTTVHVAATQVTLSAGRLECFATVYHPMVVEYDTAATFQSKTIHESFTFQ